MNVHELKSTLARFNIKPSKKLGQHFLLKDEVMDMMIDAADITKDDAVLEIGPGLGVLTKLLGKHARLVLAIEKDRKLIKALRKLFKSNEVIKVKHGDALSITDDMLPEGEYKVVANIPYYITGKLLQQFLQRTRRQPSVIVLLIQKEVALRVAAKPGSLSILGVSTQLFAETEVVRVVPRDDFYPPPDVDSAVLKLTPRKTPLFDDIDEKKFIMFVKIGFSSPRKKLLNNISAGMRIPKNILEIVFEKSKVGTSARAQELSLSDWHRLYKIIEKEQDL